MARVLISLGATLAMLAVIFGAFGAHALRDTLLDDRLRWFKTATDYQMYHALGIILIGMLLQIYQVDLLKFAGYAMLAGILLFSGSLYCMALLNLRGLGIITPFGGLAFILGWVLMLWAMLKT